jgi:hypothetical protein
MVYAAKMMIGAAMRISVGICGTAGV